MHNAAAIDIDGLAGNFAGARAAEEDDHVCDIGWFLPAAEWDHAADFFSCPVFVVLLECWGLLSIPCIPDGAVEWSLYHSGADGIDAYAAWSEVFCHDLSEVNIGCLAGAVRGISGAADLSGDAGQKDHGAGSALSHCLTGDIGEVGHAQDIDLEDAVPCGGRDVGVGEAIATGADGSAVHEDLCGSDVTFCLLPGNLDAAETGDVDMQSECDRGVGQGIGEIPADRPSTFGMEGVDDGGANTAGSSGDNCGGTTNTEVHGLPLGWRLWS